jgi:protein gp37
MALRLEAMAVADMAAGRDPKGKRKYIGVATNLPNGKAAFNGTINLDAAALGEPFHWKKPTNVFVNSMSDLFHKDVPDAFIQQVIQVVFACPQHTFFILTKRPERMKAYTKAFGAFPSNVIAVASVEDQESADERIPHLLMVDATYRGLSCEPLLGPVIINGWLTGYWKDCIHMIIAGGESGANARPLHPAWARLLRDQAVDAGVSFFFKQWGEWGPYAAPRSDHDQLTSIILHEDGGITKKPSYGVALSTSSEYWLMYKVGKHAAGRSLDGRTCDEAPLIVR